MRRWSRFFFPGVAVLAVYVGIEGGEYSLLEARRARAELADKRAELLVARQIIDSLSARIDSLRHHDETLERFARERYGFIRDGEYLYRISEGPETEEAEAPAATSVLDRLWRGLGSDRFR